MNVESAEVALAYTYAWWLTGSEQTARTAVLAAVERPDVPGADPQLRIEILLRRVRAAAITAPTMCPASELALLHDAIGIGLDSAAGLAHVDAREARTELAHGRLEALGPDAEFQITQPERLGGLAVGNPADVAAARQNEQLRHLREMILTGRDELIDLATVSVPQDLLDAVSARGEPATEPSGLSSVGVESEPLDPAWFDGNQTDDEEATEDEEGVQTDDEEEGVQDEEGAQDEDRTEADEATEGEEATRGEEAIGEEAIGEEDRSEADGVDTDGGESSARDGTPDDPDPDVAALAGADDAPVEGRDDDVDEVDPEVHRDEIDLSDTQDELELGTPGVPRRRTPWGWIVVLLLVAVLVGLYLWRTTSRTSVEEENGADTTVTEPVVEPGAPLPAADAGSPTATDEATPGVGDQGPADEPTAQAEPTAVPTPDFVLSRAGVAVGIGSEPDFDNPEADPFDPISITIEYEGAETDDALIADWTIDGEPFGTERADLSPGLDTTRFTRQVPQTGWPAGQHTLELTLERTGEVVGSAEFQVVGGATLEQQEASEAADE